MKQNTKIILVISLGIVILLNFLLLSLLLAEFFSDPHDSKETIAETNSVQEATNAETTGSSEANTMEPTPAEPTTEEPTTDEPTTEEPTTEAPKPITIELSQEQALKEVLVLYPGNSEGQVGYADHGVAVGKCGPQGFSVVGDTIYVLDSENKRILCCKDGTYREIPLTKTVEFMKCTEEFIYLITKNSSGPLQLRIYDLNGTEKRVVGLPASIISVTGISLLPSNTVELTAITIENACLVQFNLRTLEDKNMGEVPSIESQISDEVKSENAFFHLFAEVKGDLFYECYDKDTYDILINRQTADGSIRWFAKLDNTSYHSSPYQQYFTDADGKIYLMRCLVDKTVISEILLASPD